jgi:TRAP-type C4-dicarboxylate transport system permease small subunit
LTTRFDRWRGVLERVLEVIVIALMGGLAALVVVGVGFRQAGAALVWYDELASVFLAWLTYYGAALAALKRSHIGFPKLVESAAPHVRRALYVVQELVILAFLIAMVWAGWRVARVLEGSTLVSLPWVPTQLVQSVIPVGALLFMAAEILTLPARLRGAGTVASEAPGQ